MSITSIFKDFGDSSMNFELLASTDKYMSKPALLKSKINFAIHARFKAENIEIPFPQTDIYIKERVLKSNKIEKKLQ